MLVDGVFFPLFGFVRLHPFLHLLVPEGGGVEGAEGFRTVLRFHRGEKIVHPVFALAADIQEEIRFRNEGGVGEGQFVFMCVRAGREEHADVRKIPGEGAGGIIQHEVRGDEERLVPGWPRFRFQTG